jgi:glutathione S-transferase
MRLYDSLISGNAYKCRLLLHQLGIPYERVAVDILKGESRTPEFLRINPNGRTPVLEYEPGEYLAESDAILWFLSEGTPFQPESRIGRAEALQWMFFEQYNHEPNIATARFWIQHFELDEAKRRALVDKTKQGYAALGVMEQHLAREPFFVGRRYGIADIALYAYTHVAGEGGFDLAGYPAVRAWLERVRMQPLHVPITQG